MANRIIFNYPLPSQYFDIPHQSYPMAQQRSNESTDSRWSNASVESYHSYQPHGRARYTTSTQPTSQHPSYDTSRSQNYRRETSPPPLSPPKAPSERSDRESKEPQYCWHKDCLDSNGRPTRQFTRKADVHRHHKLTHDKQYIDCPRRNCNRKGEHGFTRVDHQIEHLRGYHGEDIAKRPTSHAHSRDA